MKIYKQKWRQIANIDIKWGMGSYPMDFVYIDHQIGDVGDGILTSLATLTHMDKCFYANCALS